MGNCFQLCKPIILEAYVAAAGCCLSKALGQAVGLLTRRQWRAGDVTALLAVAGRLGLEVVLPDTALLRGKERAR